jgi:hypothetical protein
MRRNRFTTRLFRNLQNTLGPTRNYIVLPIGFGEAVLIQKGTYAFDRRKINQKEIKIGEE